MTVRITKPEFNLREKISELDKPVGLKGSELMRANTVQESRDLIGAGRKNMVINGSFLVDVRNEGAELTVNSNSKFSADRWTHNNDGFTYYKTQRKNDADIATLGTEHYLRVTVTSSVTLSGSTSQVLENNLEGYTVKHLNLGTLGAKQCTLSFWVRSSLTGFFGGALANVNYDRCHPFTYTIDTANTWEYKTFTFGTYGFTTGSFNTTDGVGLRLKFSLGNGPGRQSSPDKWHGGVVFGPSGETNLVANQGATLDIAKVQLEVGKNATEFEQRSYHEELQLCRRYFYKPHMDTNLWPAYQYHNNHKMQLVQFPVQMRAVPTCTATWGNTSAGFTQYYLSKDHFKAYNGSSYSDTNSFYLTSFEAKAEL